MKCLASNVVTLYKLTRPTETILSFSCKLKFKYVEGKKKPQYFLVKYLRHLC